MGGRGASFGKMSGVMDILRNHNGISIIDDWQSDRPTKKKNPLITKLKKKHIIIMESTDSLPEDILESQMRALDELSRSDHFETFKNLTKNNPLLIRADTMESNAMAYFTEEPLTLTGKRIVLNKKAFSLPLEEIETSVKRMGDSGWSQKVDNVNLKKYIITHETGHFVQNEIVKKMIAADPSKFEELKSKVKNTLFVGEQRILINKFNNDYRNKIKDDIIKIHKSIYGKTNPKDLSEYGLKTPGEFFAETYASLRLNKNPNKLAKSMRIYLKGVLKQ